ncbi:MAG: alkaline phosphatase [Flavobacteriaceae bacterium]|nr:alkaline phosphatase [Flavobacteriaceae bacterium]
MKAWKKTSLLTTLIILVILFSLKSIFKISIDIPSSEIEFSPGTEIQNSISSSSAVLPENIIFFVADGFGFSHLSLAMMTLQSENKTSVWNAFDIKGWHDARSVYGPLTDSEASATAMFTGTSTNFGHIGIDINGDKLESLCAIASENQFSTGIVTDSYIWDGTPAAFATHTTNEDNARDILQQLAASQLDLLIGELEDLGEDEVPEEDETLEILRTRFQLLDQSLSIKSIQDKTKPIAAVFDEDQVQNLDSSPNLPQLTDIALQHLSQLESPFFLLVECEEMDAASHENDSKRVFKGLKSIEKTIAGIQQFAEQDEKTLFIFTSDHETGGLAAISDFDEYPNLRLKWATEDHTAEVVPLFAKGPGAELFSEVTRNRDIGVIIKYLVQAERDSEEQEPFQ